MFQLAFTREMEKIALNPGISNWITVPAVMGGVGAAVGGIGSVLPSTRKSQRELANKFERESAADPGNDFLQQAAKKSRRYANHPGIAARDSAAILGGLGVSAGAAGVAISRLAKRGM